MTAMTPPAPTPSPVGANELPPPICDSAPPPGPEPQGSLDVRDADGLIVARCSLWWRGLPAVHGRPAGFIGHYAAADAADTAAAELLRLACRELASHGCALAVGPIDGSTWGNYRFVTDGAPDPPFFLEPAHPTEWPRHFVDAGFWPLARYYSTVTEMLVDHDPRIERTEARLRAGGCVMRPLDPSRMREELEALYEVTVQAFEDAFLYQPIGRDAFFAAQLKLAPLLDPDLVLVAEREGVAAGFLFGIPDMQQAERGEPVDTVIIKTLAVRPGRENAGLGVCLVRRLHRTAHDLGYRRVIHALMHEANNSLNIGRASSRPLREYTLFARTL